jgi:FkbM family methyltransferase
VLRRKYVRIMQGPIKGYYWPVTRNYDYITGHAEPENIMQTFCNWLTTDAVLYDIGSNIGYYSFIACRYISTGKIYAFEPMPFNTDLFKELQRINKVNNAAIVYNEYAISDATKKLTFTTDALMAESNTYVNAAASAANITVQCFSIDDLVHQNFLPPTVLKIDVEGAEYDVLCGAAATIATYKPNILIATHDCIVPGIKAQCCNFLQQQGYVLQHTGYANKTMPGLDDYIAIHQTKIKTA